MKMPEQECVCSDPNNISPPPISKQPPKEPPSSCTFPTSQIIQVQNTRDEDDYINRPVGVIINPTLVGELATPGNEDALKFYPCKIKERERNANKAGFAPICQKETSYQRDFIYRGKDNLKCQTYEFVNNENHCYFRHCDEPKVSRTFFGRQITDLKPPTKENNFKNNETVNKIENGLFDYTREDRTKKISEYSATVSKLGGEIAQSRLYEVRIKHRQRRQKSKLQKK